MDHWLDSIGHFSWGLICFSATSFRGAWGYRCHRVTWYWCLRNCEGLCPTGPMFLGDSAELQKGVQYPTELLLLVSTCWLLNYTVSHSGNQWGFWSIQGRELHLSSASSWKEEGCEWQSDSFLVVCQLLQQLKLFVNSACECPCQFLWVLCDYLCNYLKCRKWKAMSVRQFTGRICKHCERLLPSYCYIRSEVILATCSLCSFNIPEVRLWIMAAEMAAPHQSCWLGYESGILQQKCGIDSWGW